MWFYKQGFFLVCNARWRDGILNSPYTNTAVAGGALKYPIDFLENSACSALKLEQPRVAVLNWSVWCSYYYIIFFHIKTGSPKRVVTTVMPILRPFLVIFFAHHIDFFHKTGIQTVILKCFTCSNPSFVKEINVVGKKMTRNGRKITIVCTRLGESVFKC